MALWLFTLKCWACDSRNFSSELQLPKDYFSDSKQHLIVKVWHCPLPTDEAPTSDRNMVSIWILFNEFPYSLQSRRAVSDSLSLETIQNVKKIVKNSLTLPNMVKIKSSFPPSPNFDRVTESFDKLNNTDFFLQIHAIVT